MIYEINHGNRAIHFGATAQPSSVKCGNWSEQYGSDAGLTWTDEQDKVTCNSCLKRFARQSAALDKRGWEDAAGPEKQ